jgi:hypothetical protein
MELRPPVVQPLKTLPSFYGTQRFITTFTRACHYPEPDQSRPRHPILSVQHPAILSTHLHLCLPSGLFPFGFPTNSLYGFFSPFVLYALPISSSLTSLIWLYLAKNASYEAPHYAVFSALPSLLPLQSIIINILFILMYLWCYKNVASSKNMNSISKVNNAWNCIATFPCIFVVWCLTKHKGNYTFTDAIYIYILLQ